VATRRLAKPRPVQGEQAPSRGGPPRSRVSCTEGWSPSTESGLQACYRRAPETGLFQFLTNFHRRPRVRLRSGRDCRSRHRTRERKRQKGGSDGQFENAAGLAAARWFAVAFGVGAGSYGIASAASGSDSSGSSSSAAAPPAIANGAPPARSGNPWGQQRSDETLLTGDIKAAVEKVARAQVPNGTIVRAETDADGNAAYEVHMTKADGTPVTVYVDKQFQLVSVDSR
jgi:hypothetical protein